MILGVLGGALISTVFYLLQVLGMQSWDQPVDFFLDNWFLVTPLIALFAIQTGLFSAIHQRRHTASTTMIVASGGVSSGAMVACCLHNLVFLIPLLGTTGIARFFSHYQTEVFLVSILFALIGTLTLWNAWRTPTACHYSHTS